MIQPGWAVLRGMAGDHARHRHHAVQIAVGLVGSVDVWANGQRVAAPAVMVGAGCLHQLATGPSSMMPIYVKRKSRAGGALDQRCNGRVRSLSSAEALSLALLLDDPDALEAGMREIASVLTGRVVLAQ